LPDHDGTVAPLGTRIRRRIRAAARPAIEVLPPPEGVIVDWNVPVVVRDGTTLRANVFRPSDAAPVPAIMSAHPYDKDKIGARTRSGHGVNPQYRVFAQPEPVRISAWTSWEAPDPAFWVPRGYAVVNVDLRGGGTAEGEDELFSDAEATDYFDVIEWAAAQPWCDGKVGLDGVSYLAISQYKVAALRPPHLRAICPWEGFTDLYRDFARPGGLREDGFSVVWSALTRKGARVAGDMRAEIVGRPERDSWYESVTPRLEDIEVPMLVCGSFSDHSLHSRGSFEAFRRGGSAQKWLYTHRSGKWCEYYSAEASAVRARFFDHFLKDADNGWASEPAVRVAVYEAGATPVAIEHASEWPPDGIAWTELFLANSGRTLGLEPAPVHQAASMSTRGAGLSYVWQVPEDIDVIGHMALRIHVELDGLDDANLFVGVRKLRGDEEVVFEGSFGFAADMVSKGWQRVAHRRLDATLATVDQPVHTHVEVEPVMAGEIVPVDIELRPHATRWRAGEMLRLDVRGNWFYPRDPIRGQLPTGYQKSERGTCVVHTGGDYNSRLLLGVRPVVATDAT